MEKEALGIGANIIGITSGGKLKQLCKRHKKDLVLVREGIQPRSSLPLVMLALLRVLHNSKLVENQETYVKKTIEALSQRVYSKMGENLALKLRDKIPIIYASEKYGAIAYRWRTQFNEHSKVIAISNTFPELSIARTSSHVTFKMKSPESFIVISSLS